MQYLFLLYGDESADTELPDDPTAFDAYMAPWVEYDEQLKSAGALVGGNALQPVATATTVSIANGKPVFTDGPFAETKEQLGGYYLVKCEGIEEALKLAAKCPALQNGRVEVRPIMELG